MKLTPEKRDEYLKKVYAAWLGKVIGVRLGSPVENWTSDQIMAKYPTEEGYLVDYDIYASDDDTNGPLFFVRALLDNETIDAETIGNTFLNYLQEYKGFFWWGGVGVSTEHTAYENLKKGIKAPLSGSREVNGLTMAEQIGGQIFSDCWGYVAGYDADRAKKLAAMASSVTHDGNGIQSRYGQSHRAELAGEQQGSRDLGGVQPAGQSEAVGDPTLDQRSSLQFRRHGQREALYAGPRLSLLLRRGAKPYARALSPERRCVEKAASEGRSLCRIYGR